MIFVTVGTHEQPFDRLIQCVDDLVATGAIQEEVFIQTGYSTYTPKYCKHKDLIPFSQMTQAIQDARIIISHGGPASFLQPLEYGKIPVVVPRRADYREHVNDHQVKFVRAMEERIGNIIPVYEIQQLGEILRNYDDIVAAIPSESMSHSAEFNAGLKKIIVDLFS